MNLETKRLDDGEAEGRESDALLLKQSELEI